MPNTNPTPRHSSEGWNPAPNTCHLTPDTSPEARALRHKIQAHRIKRLGWSDYVFHYITNALGFGTSLTDLSTPRLFDLWNIISTYRKSGKPYEFTYDKWGCYMHALQKKIGWEDATMRAYLLVTYQKSHWNLLTYSQKKETIKVLQTIQKEQQGGNNASSD